jgi:hypothetical protein
MDEGQVTMSRIASYASDQALQTFVLSRDEAEGEDDRGAARELIAATSALCDGWISPLAVSLLVESCDPTNFYLVDHDTPPASPSWFLRQRELDARLFVSPDYERPQERQVDAIGAAELLATAEEALDQPSPASHLEVALSVLSVNALAVALPEGIELALHYPGGPLQPVLVGDGNRQLALGPDYGPVGPPARLQASNAHGVTRITLELYWDFWIEHVDGRAQTQAAIARVLARGRDWQLVQGERP